MFSASGNKGFQITFANGNKISVQWGPMNYCEPTHPQGRNAAFDEPMKNDFWEAETVEVAAFDKDGNWHNFGHDQVIGWQTPEQVLEFMNFVANNELNISRFSYMDDEDEGENEDAEEVDSWNSVEWQIGKSMPKKDNDDVSPNFENFASTRGFVKPPNGKSWPDT